MPYPASFYLTLPTRATVGTTVFLHYPWQRHFAGIMSHPGTSKLSTLHKACRLTESSWLRVSIFGYVFDGGITQAANGILLFIRSNASQLLMERYPLTALSSTKVILEAVLLLLRYDSACAMSPLHCPNSLRFVWSACCGRVRCLKGENRLKKSNSGKRWILTYL